MSAMCKEEHGQREKSFYLPGPVLCTAVDVCAIIQQVLDNAEPAPGTCLMQSTVARIVSVIHLADSVLQAVQHHLLKEGRQNKRRAVLVKKVFFFLRVISNDAHIHRQTQ